ITLYIILALLLLNFASCEKFLDIDSPVQEITTDDVFSSDQTAEAAVVGLYSRMTATNNRAMNGFFSLYVGLAADEIWNTAPNSTFDLFRTNAILSTTSVIITSGWTPLYNYIYHANTVIEKLQNSTSVTPSTKEYLMGEMFFTRALAYFYLINFFGEVPLVLTADYKQNRLKGKSSTTEIYAKIVDDLLLAEKLIPSEYISEERIRPNNYAVKALLARVYLYNKDYENSELKATE